MTTTYWSSLVVEEAQIYSPSPSFNTLNSGKTTSYVYCRKPNYRFGLEVVEQRKIISTTTSKIT
jgi:hypothetical protein